MYPLKLIRFYTVIFAGYLLIAGHGAWAEKLSDKWQPARDHFNKLSDDACDGDAMAMNVLLMETYNDNDPVAKSNFVWVYETDRCGYNDMSRSELTDLERQAADAGYPIAQNNFAIDLLEGKGVEVDPQRALEYFSRAASAGYGLAAVTYANYVLDGEHYPFDIKKAKNAYRMAIELGADQDKLDKLKKRLATFNKTKIPDNFDWEVSTLYNQAGMDQWYDDRKVARVFLGWDQDRHGYFYGLKRMSDDPIIHFMEANILSSRGTKTALDMAGCYGKGCITNHFSWESADGSDYSVIKVPIKQRDERKILHAFKAGSKIEFLFQTRKTAKNNNFMRYPFTLDGSRKAIEQLEAIPKPEGKSISTQFAEMIAKQAPFKKQDETPTTTEPEMTQQSSATGKTYYSGDPLEGDVLCPAKEIAQYPAYFSVIPSGFRGIYLDDPTQRVKPVSTDFLVQAGTTMWTDFGTDNLYLTKGGDAQVIRIGARNGLQKIHSGSWELTPDRGIVVRLMSSEPSWNLGYHHYECDGGTMASDINVTDDLGKSVQQRTCHIAMYCKDWYDKNPNHIVRPDLQLLNLVEWAPGQVTPDGLRWTEEQFKSFKRD